jgi:hypothetical protein
MERRRGTEEKRKKQDGRKRVEEGDEFFGKRWMENWSRVLGAERVGFSSGTS